MSAVTLPSELETAGTAGTRDAHAGDAHARIAFAGGAQTRLWELHQRSPLRVLFPRPAAGDLPLAAIVNTGGGLVAGDHLVLSVTAGDGARALVMPQAAEKVYRSEGATTLVDSRLEAGNGAWLEFLPQETILFQDARFRRHTELAVAPSARLLAGEMLVFGRIARGERITRGLVRDAWSVRRDGRLVWADALHLEGAVAPLFARAAGFGGATSCATAVYVAPDAPDRLGAARGLIDAHGENGVNGAASLIGGVLVARWLAVEPIALRRAFGAFWAGFRHIAGGLPGRLPALWHV